MNMTRHNQFVHSWIQQTKTQQKFATRNINYKFASHIALPKLPHIRNLNHPFIKKMLEVIIIYSINNSFNSRTSVTSVSLNVFGMLWIIFAVYHYAGISRNEIKTTQDFEMDFGTMMGKHEPFFRYCALFGTQWLIELVFSTQLNNNRI